MIPKEFEWWSEKRNHIKMLKDKIHMPVVQRAFSLLQVQEAFFSLVVIMCSDQIYSNCNPKLVFFQLLLLVFVGFFCFPLAINLN